MLRLRFVIFMILRVDASVRLLAALLRSTATPAIRLLHKRFINHTKYEAFV